MKSEENDPEQAERVEGPNNIHWYVYICESSAHHYYVGISPNPTHRLKKHNSGQGSKMAKDQGDFKLSFISNPYLNKSEARKREIQIKGWSREKKEKLIRGEWE